MPISTSGSRVANRSSSPTARGCRRDSPASRSLEHPGDLLERAVLQQPGEQQVARLEQREVLLVLDVALRQQPRRLEVEQGGGDEQERRGLLEVPLRSPAGLDVGDELVGDLRQRDLGDVELVLGDQAEQQVERALEVVQAQLEPGLPRQPPSGARRPGARHSSRQSADQRAVVAVRLEVGEHQRDRLAHQPAAVDGQAVRRRSASRACSMSSSSSEVT